jgi:hypothetical protein
MAHPDHDAIVDAFRRVGGTIYTCNRADPIDGYTHIHGPSFPPQTGAIRCNSHAVVVEKFNGTVSPRTPVGTLMQGSIRAQCSIKINPLGHSHRENYGNFGTGFDIPSIRARWSTFDDFAREVIAKSKAASTW